MQSKSVKMSNLRNLFLYIFFFSALSLCAQISIKRWTVSDGLPTGEVQQMVALPNKQVLVNCEGVFCLSNGCGFTVLPCDRLHCLKLEHYSEDYAHWWQSDSLLWLHDFYYAYLFDPLTRTFRYDFSMYCDESVRRFLHGDTPTERLTHAWRIRLDSLGLGSRFTTAMEDWQGGIWLGTTNEGIIYRSPERPMARQVDDPKLIDLVRSTTDSHGTVWHCKREGLECESDSGINHYNKNNVDGLPHNRITFIHELADGRYLTCDSLTLLGYFYKEMSKFTLLNERLPQLSQYRRLVGACSIDDQWVMVYSQNGAFMLDVTADTLANFFPSKDIECFSNKYNCVVNDSRGQLWVGTQNGLFRIQRNEKGNGYFCTHIDGMANNCIRSLVIDKRGDVWAGTACGISRVTPTVVNYNNDDGMPELSLMERSAASLSDSSIVFVYGPDKAIMFRPEWFDTKDTTILSVVMTAMSVNGESLSLERLSARCSFPYNQNYLTFQFSALNYASPSHTRYRYRLDGLDNTWQYSTSSDGSLCEATYRALPPGKYTFEVQAAVDNGEWGETTRLVLTIRPPFWLTWWAKLFYLLVGSAVIAFLLASYLKRKRQKMERENDRRVNQLFELREEARHEFAENTNIDPQKITVNSEEEQLAERMLKALETHLSDADYGVDQLAQDVFMSRSALYTKLRNMLGISPADFIRNVRLKHAAQLLSDTDLAIGEIAERVGYNTHKAFASNFKKMFGVLPSEYRTPSIQDK